MEVVLAPLLFQIFNDSHITSLSFGFLTCNVGIHSLLLRRQLGDHLLQELIHVIALLLHSSQLHSTIKYFFGRHLVRLSQSFLREGFGLCFLLTLFEQSHLVLNHLSVLAQIISITLRTQLDSSFNNNTFTTLSLLPNHDLICSRSRWRRLISFLRSPSNFSFWAWLWEERNYTLTTLYFSILCSKYLRRSLASPGPSLSFSQYRLFIRLIFINKYSLFSLFDSYQFDFFLFYSESQADCIQRTIIRFEMKLLLWKMSIKK